MSNKNGEAPGSGPDAAPDNDPLRVYAGEERLVVSKAEVERVSARIRLRTRVEDVPVSEALRTETADIERIDVNRIVADPPQTRVENGVTIIPVVEEVMVRQFRIIEEILITSHVGTAEHAETVRLRRQEAVIDEVSDDTLRTSTDLHDGNEAI